ncbi:MAG: type II toxin-antitoxin system MqsR family toxin [Proteobacteria bacterium]|nr:type II toxin-antitoxin system MqsR family toxin [Pseudomonadota bacterium]
MEKRKPHYELQKIKAVVRDPASRPFTISALRGGLHLGLTENEMRQVVINLTRKDFYKSMTTYADNQTWQDVYHGQTETGVVVYIKITSYNDGRPPVIQFKLK